MFDDISEVPVSGKKKYTFIVSEKGTVKAKIPLDELVRLRKLGYTQNALANHFNVSQKAISKALVRAEEKGLIKQEDIGTDIIEEFDLTPEGENENMELEPKGKQESRYRCIKCHNYLTPLKKVVHGDKGDYEVHESFTHKGKIATYDRQPLSDVLIKAGYTHLCVFCMTAYRKEPRDYSKLKENKCPKCDGKILYYPVHGDLRKLVPYCEKCGIVFLKEPEDEEKKQGKTRVVKEGKSLRLETSLREGT